MDKKSVRSIRAICAALGLVVASGATASVAVAEPTDTAYVALVETVSASGASQDAASETPVRISIGPHTVEPGSARYAVRAAVAGRGVSISFSASPPARAIAGNRADFAGMPRLMPVSSARLSSNFGRRSHPITGGTHWHSGIDLAASYGAPVVATAGGRVGTAGPSGGYGLLVSLDRADGLQTRYGHLSRIVVTVGQEVGEGDVIGYVGSTGRSTGPHVHYEVRRDGVPLDPLPR
jgi:murein DD-endopeptidase MepM/ murein hydrolase activator NlpD